MIKDPVSFDHVLIYVRFTHPALSTLAYGAVAERWDTGLIYLLSQGVAHPQYPSHLTCACSAGPMYFWGVVFFFILNFYTYFKLSVPYYSCNQYFIII